MAIYIETDEEKARRGHEEQMRKANIELAILNMKYGIPLGDDKYG